MVRRCVTGYRNFLLIVILLLMIVGTATSAGNTLFAAGATFPYPLYRAYFEKLHEVSGIRILYEALGSGEGVKALLEKRVDFGATDFFLNDSLMEQAGRDILHVPTCVGAVVLTYNLPGNPQLNLTPELIAGIFSGDISYWNDARIRWVNPGISLPRMPITVVHRYDNSGTTFMFSDYLSKVSSNWRDSVGKGKQLQFPVGYGAEGNAGVSRMVSRAEGAIGYLELAYAEEAGLPKAAVQNKSGQFIVPDTRTVSLAANVDMPQDTRISITDTDAPEGYPISGYTWLIFYRQQQYNGRTRQHAIALVDLLMWILEEGQEINPVLHYAPLPDIAKVRAKEIILSIRYGDTELLSVGSDLTDLR